MRKTIVTLLALVIAPSFAGISIPLEAQTWLQTDTAKVTVSVDASSKNQDVLQVQQQILAKLDKLAKVTWHVIAMNRSEGQSGLINMNWQVTARVSLSEVNSIANKIKTVSESGMQFNLSQTDYSPSFADMQKGQAELRSEIYQEAKQVLAQANQAFPTAQYKIKKIDFTSHDPAMPMPRPQFFVKMQQASAVPVGRELTMMAVVKLDD